MSRTLNSKKNHLIFHLLAFFVGAVWGISFISTRKLLDAGIQPTEIYILRFMIAYLILAAFSYGKFRANSWKDEFLFLLCGLCGGSIYYIGENTALEYTLATNVSLLVSPSPIITVLILKAFRKTEQLKIEFILGSVVALAGVVCVIFNSSSNLEVNPIGDFLSLFAATSFAIYCIIVKRLNARYSTVFITRKMFFYGVVTALPFLFSQHHIMDFSVLTDSSVWLHILFLSVVCSLIAFAMWNEAIDKLGASRTSNYLYFSPVVTLIASTLFLDERLSLIGLMGCVLTLGGVVISEKLDLKKITDKIQVKKWH